ncbi:MAG: hypothetical protein WKF55_15880 [Gemmatimonadaceae bacterium]
MIGIRRWAVMSSAVVVLTAGTVTSLPAQSQLQSGIVKPSTFRVLIVEPAIATHKNCIQCTRRQAGFGGQLLGVLPGAALGYALAGRCSGPGDSCEFHGVAEMFAGALTGAVTGTALAAAIPRGSNKCSYRGRFGRGLMGASVGAASGVALVAVGSFAGTPIVTTATALLATLGPPFGAAFALKPC